MKSQNVKLAVVGAAAALVLVGVLCMARLVVEQRHAEDFFAARAAIEENLSSLLYNREVLRMAARTPSAAPGNQELANCLFGGDGVCAVTNPKNQIGFTLRTGLKPDDPMLAGTDEAPALYSATGKLACDKAADPDCPGWQVNVWFWADCPGGEPTCAKAERVHVRRQIRPLGNLAGLSASPPDDRFKTDPTLFNKAVEIDP